MVRYYSLLTVTNRKPFTFPFTRKYRDEITRVHTPTERRNVLFDFPTGLPSVSTGGIRARVLSPNVHSTRKYRSQNRYPAPSSYIRPFGGSSPINQRGPSPVHRLTFFFFGESNTQNFGFFILSHGFDECTREVRGEQNETWARILFPISGGRRKEKTNSKRFVICSKKIDFRIFKTVHSRFVLCRPVFLKRQ